MNQLPPPDLKRFPPAKQQQLDRLLEQNAAGSITPAEKAKLETLVAEAEELMVANAKLVADFAHSQAVQPPIDAVPVTVWVVPSTTL